MAAAKPTIPADVTTERYRGPGSETVKSVYKVFFRSGLVGWLIFPKGWGETWRLHRLMARQGSVLIGTDRSTTRVGVMFSKEEALAKVPDLVKSGELLDEAETIRRSNEYEEHHRREREIEAAQAREYNADRTFVIDTLDAMLTQYAHGKLAMTEEQARAVNRARAFVVMDIPENEIKEG